ncbi:MAG: hypothetical protein ABWZ66_02590 [Pyrinomonadaceae bacterium]
MRKQDLQNKRLDEIGRKLLESGALQSDEIERIANAPHLFDSVKAKIKTEELRRKPKRFVVNFWNWQTATGAFAILFILAIGASIFIFKTKDSGQTAKQYDAPQIPKQINQDENPSPQMVQDFPEFPTQKNPSVKNRIIAQKADFKIETPKMKNQAARKSSPTKHAQSQKDEAEGAFYSLALAGQWEADGEDLQIVRTELSRSQLFALGVNVPVENETAKIKTDLLVGTNGVPRAIRFVE